MVVIACQRVASKISSHRAAFLRLQRCHTQFAISIQRPGRQVQSILIPNYGHEKSKLRIQLTNIRHFQTTHARNGIVQFHLSDIGEGIKEVTVKEW
jgi:hypothetical protein